MSSNYPAQQPSWGPPPAAPRRKRHIGRWIGLGLASLVVVTVVASLASSGGKTDTGTATSAPATDGGISRGLGAADATADVTIDKGSVSGESGLANATLTITNHSAKRSDYYIQATLLDKAGSNIGTANALVQAVEPGQVAHTDLTGTYTGELHRLKISQVQRTASV